MNTNNPADLGILEASAALHARELSATELTDACLRRIQDRNGGEPTFDGSPESINAFAALYPEVSRQHAEAADERLAREGADAPLLCGIPLALKDLYEVSGLPVTASSRVLDGNVATSDSTVWARLRDQGMVPLGHTHCHEFAAGGTTDQVGNPYDLGRVVGGSSGGSGAALAARMTPAALGTDTCGSLRIPSACCGTSTIKPTHGLVSIDGIIPLAPSLDHAGPMARTVAECAALLQGMAGPAPSATHPPSAPLPLLPTTATAEPRPLAGLVVALTDRTDGLDMDGPVAAALEQAAEACRKLGARVVSLPSPWTLDWDDLTAVLMSEAWSYHQAFADHHDRYRPSIAEFLEVAAQFTNAQRYIEAQAARRNGAARWEAWFRENEVDLVLEPTLPIVPYGRGPGYERGHAGGAGDPMIALSAMWDMTGMPVACLPVSWEAGISLIARSGHEYELAQAAIDLQEHGLGMPPAPAFD